ncbi:hypothetical protein HN018_23875 (plasmid) [Lichenicola cladoniae]|uniref:RNA polymerase sigma factor 70 region 4 type 2 domain-containing protein n=1 Tax=Lichenicola cladoniae TaxID=1484109 RepID=A0A6M8HXZ4_9PROT|nr:sigma factor-like helix-turn-helix DNA-binding protein [Lichenicola cladoniae]QKE93218.1 hypothetical protein HN018_23875 [Lichenicola cladoniae]
MKHPNLGVHETGSSSALPPAYKEALLLTTLGGMSHLEAAQQLAVSVKAVEMRIYRAKQRLAELMNDEPSHNQDAITIGGSDEIAEPWRQRGDG